ncbi:hypothetical protein BDZ89DRAFT_1142406 [Hymenopellis radicata]|nr:hypothetical protein BDZ89DRAFT_1142406 [Hymenopellis radicata]
MTDNQLSARAELPNEILQEILAMAWDDVECFRIGTLLSRSFRRYFLPRYFSVIRCGSPSQPTRSIQTWLRRLSSSPSLPAHVTRVIIMAPLSEPPDFLAELIQLCTQESQLQSLTLVGVDLEPLVKTPLRDLIFAHTSSLILEDVALDPDIFISLMNSARSLTSLTLDPYCSFKASSDMSSQVTSTRISPSSHASHNVTSISLSLTDVASRRELFRLLHLFRQTLSWNIQSACFDVGSEPSASLTPLVAGIAPTIEYLKLTLNDCASPGDIFSQFRRLTVVTQLSKFAFIFNFNGMIGWRSAVASSPVAGWQAEAFSIRRLVNEHEDLAPSDPHMDVQPVAWYRKREPYYLPPLAEQNELSTQQMSNMVEQDESMPKLRCVVIATASLHPTFAYISLPNLDATMTTLESSSVKQYVPDAYSSLSHPPSTSRLQYIYKIIRNESNVLHIVICPIQELFSLNLKNDIATSYLRSVSSANATSFEIWTGNVAILLSRDEVLTDARETDLPVIEAELPPFLKWYMLEGRFEH